MLIILNDDHAYLAWIAHHRTGFVLDARRKPSLKQIVLHRALCPEIKSRAGKRTWWTTGARLKACSLDANELAAWARESAGGDPEVCARCQPRNDLGPQALDALAEPGRKPGLSRQALRVLDHVLEVAVIAMEQPVRYSVTVDDLAAAEAKRPGQLGASLLRLLADGYLTTNSRLVPGIPLAGNAMLHPTVKALRMLPALAKLPNSEIVELLDRLH